ncbi:hypothetical protein, partial [Ursidibacter maritimus]|uniref:hypothetical protein n=1 Tax=Ursidibacter maritimus TaxID=1331689 RepID=UPI001C45227D
IKHVKTKNKHFAYSTLIINSLLGHLMKHTGFYSSLLKTINQIFLIVKKKNDSQGNAEKFTNLKGN